MTKQEELDSGVLSKVADDEPIFVLRAKDDLAVGAILEWIKLATTSGVPLVKRTIALAAAGDMIRWARDHGSKIPD